MNTLLAAQLEALHCTLSLYEPILRLCLLELSSAFWTITTPHRTIILNLPTCRVIFIATNSILGRLLSLMLTTIWIMELA